MFPVFPAGTVEPDGAVGAGPAAAGFANTTLKQSVLFGVVVTGSGGLAPITGLNVCGKTVVPKTPHVTTAPGVVVFGLPSITACVAETVVVGGKKMMPLPDVAVVIDIVAVTGSVIVMGNVAVLTTPPTEVLAVIVAVPGFTPVTIPVAPTVAMDGSLVKNPGLPSPEALVLARCVAIVAPPASM
jgi:hypothetical protein